MSPRKTRSRVDTTRSGRCSPPFSTSSTHPSLVPHSLPPSSIPPGSDLTRIRGYRSVPADLSPRSYRPCTMPRYHIYKLSRGDRFLLLLLPSIRARKARISSLSLSLSRRRASRAISLATTRGLIYSRVTGTKRVNSLPPRYPTYTAEIFFTFFLAQCSMLQGHNHAFSPKKSRPIFTLLLLLLSLLTTRFGRFSFHENRDPLVTALPPEKNRCVVGWISLTVAMGQEMVSMVTAASEGCQQEWHGIRASIAPSPLDPDLRTADGHFGSACSAAGCARLRR